MNPDPIDADIRRHLRLCDEKQTLPNVVFLATKHGVTVGAIEKRLHAIQTEHVTETNAPRGLE